MKLILVLVAALLGLSRGADNDDLQAAQLFIACVSKALDGGIPSIPIPDHNPLHIRNITYNDSNILYDFSAAFTNNVLDNILDYNVTQLEATSYLNINKAKFDYAIYWPILNLTGDYDFAINSVFDDEKKGSFNLVIHHMTWGGLFNLTKPGQEDQGIKEHLDEFTLTSTVEDVTVDITGDADNSILEGTIRLAVLTALNNIPASLIDVVKDDRINGFWIDHPERIQAILDNCAS